MKKVKLAKTIVLNNLRGKFFDGTVVGIMRSDEKFLCYCLPESQKLNGKFPCLTCNKAKVKEEDKLISFFFKFRRNDNFFETKTMGEYIPKQKHISVIQKKFTGLARSNSI